MVEVRMQSFGINASLRLKQSKIASVWGPMLIMAPPNPSPDGSVARVGFPSGNIMAV
jgi:hypothetical protein